MVDQFFKHLLKIYIQIIINALDHIIGRVGYHRPEDIAKVDEYGPAFVFSVLDDAEVFDDEPEQLQHEIGHKLASLEGFGLLRKGKPLQVFLWSIAGNMEHYSIIEPWVNNYFKVVIKTLVHRCFLGPLLFQIAGKSPPCTSSGLSVGIYCYKDFNRGYFCVYFLL